MLTTEGIVVRTLKYGETSLILDIYTKERGLVSCIAGGVRKRKTRMHASSLQLLQLVRISLYYKDSDRLSRVKEVQPLVVLNDLVQHPIKRVLVLFMAELLQKTIKEKEDNTQLYEFLNQSIQHLDKMQEGIANFHLIFMSELASFLGFKPVHNYDISHTHFDLEEGRFVDAPDLRKSLPAEQSALISALLATDLEQAASLSLNQEKRRIILEGLIKYYQYHVDGFGMMKSPEIIHVILS